jgi:hypothetical protein
MTTRAPAGPGSLRARRGLLAAAVACWGLAAGAEPVAEDAAPVAAERVLANAFARRYGMDFTSNIELVIRNQSGQELRRTFRAASKLIDGRVHSVGRLVEPEFLRGMTILTIEAPDRGHDSFLFLPSLDKVRRVTTAQRADSFLGSDVTYEDLERLQADEYEIESMVEAMRSGEPVRLVRGRPRREFSYDAVAFAVAADGAILETEYFKRAQPTPYRVIVVPRSGLVSSDGFLFPSHLRVENHHRGTVTEVFFRDLQLDAEIPDSIFTATALEKKRPIPGKGP